jgi:N utilization substance protein A
MDASEFIRLVDTISRDRGLSKDRIISDIEAALIKAAEKRFEATGEFSLTIDRNTGEIRAYEDDQPVDLTHLGRIVANVAKQVITQGLREGERDLQFDHFIQRHHTVVSGTVLRMERGAVIVNLGRAEAILPREEQIPGEVYRAGATVRAYLLKVEKRGQRLRLVLSRTHTGFVRELFVLEVPEIADGLIEIKGIVREAGRRTKIAVAALDDRIDPVGSCVGMRGSRISKIADELSGEKIDIIPWAEDEAQFIINSLKPAGVLRVSYDAFRDRARVVVSQDQLPLAIGKAGQNVRLSARLTRFKIDVMSEEQNQDRRMRGSLELQPLVDETLLEDFQREILLDNHLDSLAVLAAQTPDILIGELEEYHEDHEKAQKLIDRANDLLNEDQKAERDQLIQERLRREEEESRAEADALMAAAEAGVMESFNPEEAP